MWKMKTVRWHLCLSIILLVIFQVSTGVHNTAADYSPIDEYSDVENQREHLLDTQKYTRFNYRAKRKDMAEEVRLLERDQPVCAGAIISKTFVLTAAHCVEKEKFPNLTRCQRQRKPKECYLKASWFLVKFPGKQHPGTMKIKRIIPHQSFAYQKLVYDIALLELEKPLKCTRKTSPICLPTKEMYKTGQKLYVAGWGENKEEGTRKYHI
ncbi:hypothetical protein TNCT_278301 [Trichonephila clavata]|uniref:Peptidase S1 domain-containing protein n=1 Tax=Trichonephila clavata TaxID=2740835 RepID=A0A8X6J376_TRICU|nr:hypothetical protein TNCT_278301 [Trichonephila clavata]